MKKEFTIIGAALEVLKSEGKPMSIQEIYNQIIDKSLYAFHAQNPLYVFAG